MVYNAFDKGTSVGVVKNENMSHQDLGEELRNPIIRKFEKQKVYSVYRKYLGLLILLICN